MTTTFNSPLLAQFCEIVADQSAAGLSMRTSYSAAGFTVTPPAGTLTDAGKPRPDAFFGLPDGRQGVTIDSWGSQARRWSKALGAHAEQLGLPVVAMVLDDQRLTDSWDWSHRHCDAIFRAHAKEVMAAGVDHAAIMASSPQRADALLEWFPQSLVCGWWDSHVGKAAQTATADAKKAGMPNPEAFDVIGSGAKSPRVMSSEIIAKGASLRTRFAGRVDPVFGAIATAGKASVKPSKLGFGSIPPVGAPLDVTFEELEGRRWISFSMLRKLDFVDHDADQARAALAVLALAGTALSAGDLHLRSGSDLVVDGMEVTLEQHLRGGRSFDLPSHDELLDAVREASGRYGWRRVDVDVSGSANLVTLLKMSAASVGDEDA